jgi:hypothetical protein
MDIFKILGSKWFALILGLGMLIAIPYTYTGMKVSYNIWATVVFICNLGAVLLCSYKFMSLLTSKKQENKEW